MLNLMGKSRINSGKNKTVSSVYKCLFLSLKFAAIFLMGTIEGCKYPVYESKLIESKIEIIGMETCNKEGEGNYWLINVEVTTGEKAWGIKSTIDGIAYNNVVKTNFNLSEFAKNKQIYYMLTGGQETSLPYPCALSDDQIFPTNSNSIPVVTIHRIALSPRLL